MAIDSNQNQSKDKKVLTFRKNNIISELAHTILKYLSKSNLNILIIDSHRSHYFKNGKCICNDYF